MAQIRVVFPSEDVEVAEADSAERSSEEGEPGGAVGGVEEGSGEGDQVEDFWALGEEVDLVGAEGDGAGAGFCRVDS
jgi:hypothetical protein